MTATTFSTSDVQTVKRWSDRVAHDAISDQTLVGQMINDGTLILKNDLAKAAGDNVKYHFLNRISDAGLIGNQAATGNELALTYHQDTVTINQLRQVVQIPNKNIDAQRVTFNMPEDTYQVLRNWMTERMAVSALWQLAGFTNTTPTYDGVVYTASNYLQLTGMNAVTAPSSTRIIRANGTSNTTDQAVQADTTATMKFSQIDEAVESARINRPYIKPFEGAIKFKCYVHYKQFRSLIQDTTGPIQYRDIMLSKIAGGMREEALIGETMEYNQTRIIATDKVPLGCHSSGSATQANVRRAVFCGQEAGAVAFGQGFTAGSNTTPGFSFEQDFVDVNQYKRIAISNIWGLEKTIYNSIDNGSIVISTYVPS